MKKQSSKKPINPWVEKSLQQNINRNLLKIICGFIFFGIIFIQIFTRMQKLADLTEEYFVLLSLVTGISFMLDMKIIPEITKTFFKGKKAQGFSIIGWSVRILLYGAILTSTAIYLSFINDHLFQSPLFKLLLALIATSLLFGSFLRLVQYYNARDRGYVEMQLRK